MRTFVTLLLLVFNASMNVGFADQSKPFVDFSGNPKSVEDFFDTEKWTIVMIWRHDCHICNNEAESYVFLHDGNETIQVLGLSIDGQENKQEAQNFIMSHALPFENLLGEIEVVGEYYHNLTGRRFIGTPTFLLFNPDGKLMTNRVGAVPPEVFRNYINRSIRSEDK